MYDWRKDINYADEMLSSDETYNIRHQIAYNALLKDGWNEDDPEFEGVLYDEIDSYAKLFCIRTNSALYSLLEQWYKDQNLDMTENIRNYYEDAYGNYIYFTAGGGYEIFDADLLGGDGSGITQNAFDDFVDSKGI